MSGSQAPSDTLYISISKVLLVSAWKASKSQEETPKMKCLRKPLGFTRIQIWTF